jgi:hypothetical protein
MPKFLFINPSPNLKLIANALLISGQAVQSVYTADYSDFIPKEFRIFMGTRHVQDRYPGAQPSSWALQLKKAFFSSKNKQVQEILDALDPMLAFGSAQDCALLGGEFWREPRMPLERSDMDTAELIAAHPNATVFTAQLPASNGKHYLIKWQTDFDAEKTLGKDYFFFFDGKHRHELFYSDGALTSLSPSKNLDWLFKLNPAMKKFEFSQINAQRLHRNMSTWLAKHSRVWLVNDYSWQRVSIKLPQEWADRIIEMVTEK